MRNGQSPELQEAIQLLGEASPEIVTAVLTLLKQGREVDAGHTRRAK